MAFENIRAVLIHFPSLEIFAIVNDAANEYTVVPTFLVSHGCWASPMFAESVEQGMKNRDLWPSDLNTHWPSHFWFI